jgi:hypothetical protein
MMAMDPFVYLSRPLYKSMYRIVAGLLVFEQDVEPCSQTRIDAIIPPPLRHDSNWLNGSALFVQTDDWFEIDLRIAYNTEVAAYSQERGLAPASPDRFSVITKVFDDEPTAEEYAAFSTDVDAWLKTVHGDSPLCLAYTSETIDLDGYADWLRRSVPQIPEIVPALTKLVESDQVRGGPGAVALENLTRDIVTLYGESEYDPSPAARAGFARLVRAAINMATGCDTQHWQASPIARLLLDR